MNKPIEITLKEWTKIIQNEDVRRAWGLVSETPEQFAASVYGVKFNFHSGSPGYVGDLYMIQGDVLNGDRPIMIIRQNGMLITL